MGESAPTPSHASPGLSFPLARRLKRKRFIEPLFDRTNPDRASVHAGCVRILYRFVSPDAFDAPFQVGVAVGRSRGNAPRRNRVKRIIRDALRHSQDRLETVSDRTGQALTAMVLFQGSDESPTVIREHLSRAMDRLDERSAADA